MSFSESSSRRQSASSFRNSIVSMKTAIKEHHTSVQNAYEAFYGIGYQPTQTQKRSSLVSAEPEAARNPSTSSSSKSSGRWQNIKNLAKEHHKAVNGAYTDLYGVPAPRK
jgi:hypothetical protein